MQTESQAGYLRTTQCFRDKYREEQVPGTKARPGYVRNWTEKVEIACEGAAYATYPYIQGTIYPQMILGCADRLNRVLLEKLKGLGE